MKVSAQGEVTASQLSSSFSQALHGHARHTYNFKTQGGFTR